MWYIYIYMWYIHVIYTCEIMFIYVIYIHVTLPGVSLHFQISLFYNVLHLCSFNDSSSLRWTWPMRRESMQSWLPRPHSMTTWRRPRRFMGFRTFIAQAGDSLSLPQHIYNMLWEYIRIWKKTLLVFRSMLLLFIICVIGSMLCIICVIGSIIIAIPVRTYLYIYICF